MIKLMIFILTNLLFSYSLFANETINPMDYDCEIIQSQVEAKASIELLKQPDDSITIHQGAFSCDSQEESSLHTVESQDNSSCKVGYACIYLGPENL